MMSASRTDESFLADKATQDWINIIMRASVACPTDLDSLLVMQNNLAHTYVGQAVFHDAEGQTLHRNALPGARATIAVVLDDAETRTPDAAAIDLAMRYAALAIEKECDVVIMSHQNNAGFERFGFRVERIAGKTEAQRKACLDQLIQFWGAEIVI